MTTRPVVLVLAGHDPVGGAGIQADIETLCALGCHAATAITALTVQDTRGVSGFEPVSPALCIAQAQAVMADLTVSVIKIGMVGSPAMAEAIAALLDQHPEIPVVLDPVMAGGGGGSLARGDMAAAIRTELLPRVRLITPNGPEACLLAGRPDAEAAAQQLSLSGTAVLLTGGHADTPTVRNQLWVAGTVALESEGARLPGAFHGSGCTLASACAALMAHGRPLADACQDAHIFTLRALTSAHRLGRGQALPDRRGFTP